MMRRSTVKPRRLTITVSARIPIDPMERSKSMVSVRGRREPAIREPFRQALRPVADAHVLRALPHVEGMLALRVDVQLDRRMRGVIFAGEIEQHITDALIVRRTRQEQRR